MEMRGRPCSLSLMQKKKKSKYTRELFRAVSSSVSQHEAGVIRNISSGECRGDCSSSNSRGRKWHRFYVTLPPAVFSATYLDNGLMLSTH